MANEENRLLIIDQDQQFAETVENELADRGFYVRVLSDPKTCPEVLRVFNPDFLLVDLPTVGNQLTDFFGQVRLVKENAAIIVISDTSTSDRISESLQLGAEDFVTKPFDPALVEIAIRNILEKRKLRDQVNRLKNQLDRDQALGMLVGESTQMVSLRETIQQVSQSDLSILIRGESGTGKDVTSRLIHQLSQIAAGPFIKVNCAALPENLIESELFGYEKGAFTGAARTKPGRFQLADGGTIFLDEVTEIPFQLQSKLLQVLDHNEFMRVGGTKTIKVECRAIAASNADMERAMAEHRFREDLFYRLNEFSIFLPALRDRRDDIPLLIDYFLRLYSERYQRERPVLSRPTLDLMIEYDWPGNVRELEGLLKRYLVLEDENIILETIRRGLGGPSSASTFRDITAPHRPQPLPQTPPQPIQEEPPQPDPSTHLPAPSQREAVSSATDDEIDLSGDLCLKDIVEQAVAKTEKKVILEALNRTRWNRRKTASMLGVSYSSLLRRIEKYDLEN